MAGWADADVGARAAHPSTIPKQIARIVRTLFGCEVFTQDLAA
jgi:hypothetical protein